MTSARRHSVLVIEDDLDQLEAMAVALRAAGYDVQEAADGDEGRWLFGRQPADVVVTDLVAPGGDGLETIAAVKRQHPQTRIIAVASGHSADPDDEQETARKMGADDVLAEPFTAQELADKVGRILAAPS